MTKKELSTDEIANELHRLLGELLEIAKAAERIAKLEKRLDDLEATVFGGKDQ